MKVKIILETTEFTRITITMKLKHGVLLAKLFCTEKNSVSKTTHSNKSLS